MNRHLRYRHCSGLALLGCLIWLSAALSPVWAQTATVVEETVHSVALEKNLLGDSPERSVTVYLPPGYAQSSRSRYPAVYLLHGYLGSNKVWSERIPRLMDRLIAARKIREMIIVMPDGSNRYGGSFYTNSISTGNWEDFISRDLTKFIDTKYRTLSQASSRGIAGHSMGGYGAIKLAMKHPEVYGAVYGLSACCLGWGVDLSLTNPAWDKTLDFKTTDDFLKAENGFFKEQEERRRGPAPTALGDSFYSIAFMALSAAWSPNPRNSPLYASFPVEGRDGARKPVPKEEARWSANMPLAMLDRYRSNLSQLGAIAFDVGTEDEFPHIVTGAHALSRALERNRIQHSFEEYEGTHGNRIPERIELRVLPFFSRTLEFATRAMNK